MKNMRKIFCFFIVVIGIISCKKNFDGCLENAPLIPKANIYAILDSFVTENKYNNYIYELYIDKETPDEYLLTIYCGKYSLTKEENYYRNQIALNYTIISDVKFNIFSGVEHYFTRENDTIEATKSDGKYYEQKIWIVKDSFNVISVYKGIHTYPFIPLPIRFTENIFILPINYRSGGY
jgi:hypothetical protein